MRRYAEAVMLGLVVVACAKPAPTVAPAPSADTVYVTVVDSVRLEAPRDTLHERLAGRLQMQLLEREAEVADLKQKLDEAMREVVRTMARLQTIATRAEAASAMAEAELAFQALRNRPGAGAVIPEVRRLLQQSSEEFGRSNFAGAIYLANQGKRVASGVTARAPGAAVAGETPFATQVSLTVTARANVRGGPGTQYGVRRTLDRGAVVQGISHVGEWVRIALPDGGTGWMLGALLEGGAPSGQ